MSKEWSPFDEATGHLNRYKSFFPRDEVFDGYGDDPQMFEDWLNDNCHNNYCYAWVWDSSNKIVGQLTGVPKNLVLAVKLVTGVDPLFWKDFNVRGWPPGSVYDRFKIYSIGHQRK